MKIDLNGCYLMGLCINIRSYAGTYALGIFADLGVYDSLFSVVVYLIIGFSVTDHRVCNIFLYRCSNGDKKWKVTKRITSHFE